MKVRLSGYLAAAALGVVVLAATAGAEPAGPVVQTLAMKRAVTKPARRARDERVFESSSTRLIDVNNINMFVTNLGSWANNFADNNNAGFYFPKGTIKTAVYESGLWLGAKVVGEAVPRVPRVTVAEYSQEFGPGPMLPDHSAAPDDPKYTVYKMVRFTGDPNDTAHVERAQTDKTVDPIVHHSWSEYMAGAAPYGAPWKYYRLPTAVPGDSVDVPGPDVSGDQMLWSVYNDADPTLHANNAGHSLPLGVEVQQTTFGFNRQGSLGNTVFMKFTIINKGTNTLDSMFVSLWADPDLGGAGDDLVGCDTTTSVGFVYNATNSDAIYGNAPPCVGYDFFQGPKVGSTILPLTSFNKYINGTDPQTPFQTYNYMLGLNPDGTQVINPINNAVTTFTNPGDPVANTGWLDDNPSDRRFMLSAGPFTMAPGDTQFVVGGIVVGQGGDRLSSITGMKFFDVDAQRAFDANFNLPSPPPQPKVSVGVDHGKINLCWDSNSRFNYTSTGGFTFEGYVVYQGASQNGPWKRLAVYDEVDGIQVVRDTVFDLTLGQEITDFPVAFGGDNGVQYCYSTTSDAINGGSLVDGMPYYFAVTAYGYSPTFPDPILEDRQEPVTVVPQRPASGTDYSTAQVNAATVVSSASPKSNDYVKVDITDPSQITGHTYSVRYSGAGPYTWSLVDENTGQTLISNQSAKTETPSYAPVDGMNVKVLGGTTADNTVGEDVFYTGFRVTPGMAPVDFGLSFFGGGADIAFNFFNGIDPSVDPTLMHNVELRYSPNAPQKAYRYFRDQLASGSAPSTGRGYGYGGFKNIAWQAWDMKTNQQLDVGFVERRYTDANGVPTADQPASNDGTWDPTDPGDANREYLVVSSLPYTGTEAPSLAADDAFESEATWMWALTAYNSGPLVAGDKFTFLWGTQPGTPADTLRFTTVKGSQNVVALQKANMSRIRAVPNPYYAHSAYEFTSLERVIKFVNMPENATVRIFNLAGDLIRTLHKTDPSTSILQWDLLTENRLPVASGVYVFHVDVPGAGSYIGKLVVFVEKERLSTF